LSLSHNGLPSQYSHWRKDLWFQASTYTVIISWALAFWYAQSFFEQAQQQQIEKLEKERLNDAIKQAELTNLKKQISPHFFTIRLISFMRNRCNIQKISHEVFYYYLKLCVMR
jgi:hypothetical protein